MGFVTNTLEKVCRLTRVLHFIEKDPFLYKSLGFKGGTAINLAIFKCPRLSVDIDLDFCLETTRGEMLKARRDIKDVLLRSNEITNFCELFTGTKPKLNQKVFNSEMSTADRNKSLAYFLNSTGLLMDSVENSLDLYIKLCSLECTTLDLAKIADVLSCGGKSSFTGKYPLSFETVKTIMGIMITCGLYNGSGECAVRVGIPAKSGVSGGILAVAPGKMGIGVFSPPLDSKGNSLAGLYALEMLSDKLNLRGVKILD